MTTGTQTKKKNLEQLDAIERIRNEDKVPMTGPPGTGKSTVLSHSCLDLINDYSPVLIVSPYKCDDKYYSGQDRQSCKTSESATATRICNTIREYFGAK